MLDFWKALTVLLGVGLMALIVFGPRHKRVAGWQPQILEAGDSTELLDGREPSPVYDRHRDHLRRRP